MQDFLNYNDWCKEHNLPADDYDSLHFYFLLRQKANLQPETEVITIEDIKKMLDVKYSTASKIMREVKEISNRLDIKGKIHVLDWSAYLERKGECCSDKKVN